MAFTGLLAHVAQLFDAIGAAVLVVGLVWSVVVASLTWRTVGGRSAYQALRETFGGVLLLALEILVAADLITTVAVAPTLRNVAVLGLIVLMQIRRRICSCRRKAAGQRTRVCVRGRRPTNWA